RLREARVKTIAYDVQFTEPTDPAEDNALIEAVAKAKPVVLATTEVNERGEANVFGGPEVLRDIGARAGNALLPPDQGGVIRRLPYSVNGLDTLAIASAETASGRRIDPADLGQNQAWIDYRGPPETIDTVSF